MTGEAAHALAGDGFNRAWHTAQLVQEIRAERDRQVLEEGYEVAHDDAHGPAKLLRAAGAYIDAAQQRLHVLHTLRAVGRDVSGLPPYADTAQPWDWPWSPEWWKPKDPRRDMVRAGALLLAALECADRQAAAERADEEG